MINPRTNKAINPNTKFKIKLPNDARNRLNSSTQEKTFTAKDYFDQLNAFEEELSKRGMTLRDPNTFKNLRVEPVNKVAPNSFPSLPKEFQTTKFEMYKPSPSSPFSVESLDQTIVAPSLNTLMKVSNLEWNTQIYVAETGESLGTNEFPAKWVIQSLGSKGRKKFPILVQVTKGYEKLVSRVRWQVSEKPFDGNEKSTPVLVANGEEKMDASKWSTGVRGVDALPQEVKTSNVFSVVYADLSKLPEPENQTKNFYARTVLLNAAGEITKVSNPVILTYGGITQKVYVPVTKYMNSPPINYTFPSDSKIPFGVFLKGEGLRAKKITIGSDNGIKPLGYKVEADARAGLKYFNFLSLVNSSEPTSKELNIVKGSFKAVSGNSTSSSNQNEPAGVSLSVEFLDGLVKESIPLTEKAPNGGVSLSYKVKQTLDIDLLNIRFMIGPVPIAIKSKIGGEAGLELTGSADLVKQEIVGSLNPYISSRFEASGGVDAFIAYATLNAKVDPLLYFGMPMTFTSAGSGDISMEGKLKGLYGKVFLKVGFYYPCPDLGKVVGWLAGDEDVPLCECAWEYNIFDFNGFEHDWKM